MTPVLNYCESNPEPENPRYRHPQHTKASFENRDPQVAIFLKYIVHKVLQFIHNSADDPETVYQTVHLGRYLGQYRSMCIDMLWIIKVKDYHSNFPR